MTYQGTVKNGRVELPDGVRLPEGMVVRVEPVGQDEDSAYGLAEEAVSTGVSDLAARHDHYVYGLPKRTD